MRVRMSGGVGGVTGAIPLPRPDHTLDADVCGSDLLIAIFHPASRSGDRSFYNGEDRLTPRRVVRLQLCRLLSNQG